MKEIKITNLVKFYTLLLLYGKPKYGYEIIKEIEEKTNRKVSPGQIYPFLKKLEKYKYLKVKKTGVREKKIYSLTKNGKIFVKKTLNRLGGLVDIAIEPRLTICSHCGCRIYKSGHRELIKGKRLIFCCQHCARSYKSG
jgi:DNA-binding PadR family transcriptional regulator